MQNIAVFRRVFEDAGYPPHVIDGILANLIFESGGQTDINTRENTGDGGRARGAAQWQGDRWSGPNGLLAFANQRGTDWTDPETQALFTVFELQGPERSTYERLLTAPDASAATEIFMTGYERPGTPHLDGRLNALSYVSGGTPQFTSPGQPTPATSNTPMPDRPVLSRMASNWRERAEGGTPTRDRWQEFLRSFRAGEKPIANGIARFLENLAQRPRGGTETGGGTTPGLLGPGMNMTSWRTPNPAAPGAPPAPGAAAAPPSPQMSSQERLQQLLAGPHAEAIRTAIAGAIGSQPGPSSPPVMPITTPAMPVQWPPQQQQQPQPPATPDWNPWAMLGQQPQPQAQLSPPQPMPGPEEFYNTLGNVAPVFSILQPFSPSSLSPPTTPPVPMSGARRFPPRFTPAPFLPQASLGGLLRG